MSSVLFKATSRGSDNWGSGHFGASRGSRVHKGIDITPAVLSPVSGTVSKIGYAYRDDLSYRYVQITDENDMDVRVFYISPSVKLLETVEVGDEIGIPQDLTSRYEHIRPHIHIEVIGKDGDPVDPIKYLDLKL